MNQIKFYGNKEEVKNFVRNLYNSDIISKDMELLVVRNSVYNSKDNNRCHWIIEEQWNPNGSSKNCESYNRNTNSNY